MRRAWGGDEGLISINIKQDVSKGILTHPVFM